MKFTDVRKYITGLLSASFVNKEVLDNLAENKSGSLTYKGAAIEGGGTAASIPDNIVLYAEGSEVTELPTGGSVMIDSELSTESENPVQNKVITEKLNEVFQSVSEGKQSIASALTDMGIETSSDASFEEIVTSIRSVVTGNVGTGVIIDRINDYAYAIKEE